MIDGPGPCKQSTVCVCVFMCQCLYCCTGDFFVLGRIRRYVIIKSIQTQFKCKCFCLCVFVYVIEGSMMVIGLVHEDYGGEHSPPRPHTQAYTHTDAPS